MKKIAIVVTGLFTLFAGTASANTFALTITNGTRSTVETFYASPTGVSDWEEDLFGPGVLAPGDSITVRFSDARGVCDYDMLFEFSGDALEDLVDTQNLCEVVQYTLHE